MEDESKRLHVIVPVAWLQRIDDWRRQQSDRPNLSEAIRRPVDMGLAAAAG